MATVEELKSQIFNAEGNKETASKKMESARSSIELQTDAVNQYTKIIENGVNGSVSRDDVAFAQRALNVAIENRNYFRQEYDNAKTSFDAAQSSIDSLSAQLSSLQDPTATVKDSSSTTPSASATETTEKYKNADIVGNYDVSRAAGVQVFDDGSTLQTFDDGTSLSVGTDGSSIAYNTEGKRTVGNVPPGAVPKTPPPPTVNFKNAAGDTINKDFRAKIRVPKDYLSSIFTSGVGKELVSNGGIIFPYTPTISIESKANYSNVPITHSNYSHFFYSGSDTPPLEISGKFTVQNDADAAVFIAIMHLLRALTKMRFGNDRDAGAPPPVCRLDAFGAFMYENVPIVIQKFKVEPAEGADFYTIGNKTESIYEKTSVPVVSTISLTCPIVYSRQEMQKFNVTAWLGNKALRKSGIL